MPLRRWLTPAMVALAPLAFFPASAQAHPDLGIISNSVGAGLLHPFTGVDHLLAMLASGLLAVRIGTRRALWAVPCTFVALMIAGALLASAGVPLPRVEWAISASVIVLGVAVAALARVPLWGAALIVGSAALFHGHAHAAEFHAGSLTSYMLGFCTATLVLHVCAIALGVVVVRTGKPSLVRIGGAGIVAAFTLMLIAGVNF